MSTDREIPEPGEGQFWIDLPAPVAKPAPSVEDSDGAAAPAVSADDPGAIFGPGTEAREPEAPPTDEVGEGDAPDGFAASPPVDELVSEEPVSAEPPLEMPEASAHQIEVAEDEAALTPPEETEPDEEGAAAFVPVLLGGALALAIAIGLEAAGLWSTLLPP